MPINPSIALGVEGPTSRPVLQTLADVLQLKGLQQDQDTRRKQSQVADLQLRKVEREEDEDQKYRDTILRFRTPEGEIDWRGAERDLLGQGLTDHAKKARVERESIIDRENAEYTTQVNRLGQQVKLVRPLFDSAAEAFESEDPKKQAQAPELWKRAVTAARSSFSQRSIGPDGKEIVQYPEWIESIPADGTPEVARQIADFGLTVDESVHRQNIALAKSKEARDAKKAGQDATKLDEAWVANLYAIAATQADVDRIFKIAADRDVDEKVLGLFDKTWSKDAVGRAKAMTMTEKERQESAARARTAATAEKNAETMRLRLEREASKKLEDDPSLPMGVRTYLASLPQQYKTLDEATKAVRGVLANLHKDHPRLDDTKVLKTVNAIYGKASDFATFLAESLAPDEAKPTPQDADPPEPEFEAPVSAPPPVVTPPSAQAKDDGDIKAIARKILEENGQPTSDAAIDFWLRNPINRRALGMK